MLVWLTVLCLMRLAFIGVYVIDGTWIENLSHMPLFVWNAFRFDMQVAAYAVLGVIAPGLIWIVIGGKWFRIFCKWYGTFVVVVMIVLGFSDIVFYGNFGCHFNHVTFDLFDEEPLVLLKGVWHETPIIRMVLITIVVAWLCSKIVNKVVARGLGFNGGRIKSWFTIVGSIVVIVVSIRGSVGTFTLRAEDIYVSPSGRMNDCVPNALFMLKKAWSEKQKQFDVKSVSETLSEDGGFESVEEAMSVWLDVDIDSVRGLSVEDCLWGRTGSSPRCAGMNVVVILTESWSNRLMDYEGLYDMDLLGEMRKHLGEDILFRNFLSATNGTIDAVEHFTVSSAYPHLFTSSYRNIDYPTASAKMFRDNGYETLFVSGIEISWRNLMEVLPHQGFDKVIGKYELLQQRPEAECNKTWGVFDHAMLEYVNDLLVEDSDKPKFLLCLTATSHTPFEFPSGYNFADINLSDKTMNAFAANRDVVLEYLRGYQYESNELGRFMTRLKNSSAAKNTVVVITGDHNIRLILPYGKSESGSVVNDMWWKYAVPLYMYIPDSICYDVDVNRFGCHADVMPTLAHLTLNNAGYFNVGQDLLADSLGITMGFNVESEITDGDIMKAKRKSSALRALKKIYFQTLFERLK